MVLVLLWLLDAVLMGLVRLVVSGMVLGLGHGLPGTQPRGCQRWFQSVIPARSPNANKTPHPLPRQRALLNVEKHREAGQRAIAAGGRWCNTMALYKFNTLKVSGPAFA